MILSQGSDDLTAFLLEVTKSPVGGKGELSTPHMIQLVLYFHGVLSFSSLLPFLDIRCINLAKIENVQNNGRGSSAV